MKNTILLAATLFLFSFNIFAQAPAKQWDFRFGGSSTEALFSLQQTTDGGYIQGGYSNSDISGDRTQASQGAVDYWIVKTDASGVKQWDARFGGSADDALQSLQQTTDGGYILGGYSSSGISGDKTQVSQGAADYWVVKINSSGVKQWDARFGGSNNDFFYSLQQTTDGGYILGGESRSGISGDKTQPLQGLPDYWVVKINSSGVKQWDANFGGNSTDFLYSLQQTTDGGYILGGESASGISGDKTQASQGGRDYWVVKITDSGVKQWDARFGGSLDDRFSSLQQTSDGGYILGGYSTSGISGDKTQASQGLPDYWVVKINSSGVKQWDARFGGSDTEGLGSLQQTTDGGYILGGHSNSGISGDRTQASQGGRDYWVVKITDSGVKQWDARFGGSADEVFHSLQQTTDGGYILGGHSTSGISGDRTQASQGEYDYWVVKLAPTCPASGTACNDGNACTTGDVEDGSCNCAGTPLVCDDGLFCTGTESCNPGTGCIAGTPPTLSDGIACTADACDEANNVVTHTPNHALCDDGNPNTTDVCHPTLGCQNNPNNNIPTLSEWGLIIFGLLLLCTGAVAVWRKKYGSLELEV